MVTHVVENYLKAIYSLQQDGSPATTNAIAEQLEVRAASVTSMLQQLSEQGLAAYTRYRGAYLTGAGLEVALRVIRRHRLLELYLHQYLDVPWDRVHDEAERLEHALSPYLEARLDARLNHPQFDPHGSPIPSSTGALPVQDIIPLYELPLDTPAIVRHVPDNNSDLLRYVASLGLVPDSTVTVLGRDPLDGPVSLDVISAKDPLRMSRVVSAEMARAIFVTRPVKP